MPPDPTGCLFCGASGARVLSKEHVIPKWLLGFLHLPDDDQMFHGVFDSATGELVSQRTHSSFTFVEGRVCRIACNRGWMNRLETATLPILKSLIVGTRALKGLSPEERRLVGKWAVKTSYMHSWAGLLGRPVGLEHLRALNGDDGLPEPGVAVVGMQADFERKSMYLQSGHWPHFNDTSVYEGEVPEAYKIALQFGRLYLLTAFWPNPRTNVVLAAKHTPIWPLDGSWPIHAHQVPPGSIDNELSRFATNLGVFHWNP